jgi:hypothetical protein
MGLLYGRTGRLTTQNGGFRRGQYPNTACSFGASGGREFCDASLPTAARARDLIGRMTLDEQVLMIQPLVELYGGCMVVLKVS